MQLGNVQLHAMNIVQFYSTYCQVSSVAFYQRQRDWKLSDNLLQLQANTCKVLYTTGWPYYSMKLCMILYFTDNL